jgi:AAA+ superfamily predicted ATPase
MLFKKNEEKDADTAKDLKLFHVRVCPDYAFASERLEELGSFWKSLENEVKKAAESEMILYRFTFALYNVKAATKENCRTLVINAWKKVFGEEESVPELIIIEGCDDEVLDDTYIAILKYYGVTEYQKLIADLAESFPILNGRGGRKFFIKQNYLFAIDRGCGFSRLLSSMSHYLRTLWVFPEDPDENAKRYVTLEEQKEAESENAEEGSEEEGEEPEEHRGHHAEIIIGKESDEGGCTSVDDFIGQLESNSGSRYYSSLGIDISYFLEGKRTEELRQMLKRMEPYQSEYVFLFRVPFLEKKALDEIEGILEDAMILKTVKVPPLNECVVLETVWNIINETDYVPNTGLIPLILDKIHDEKRDGRFYGFKTAEKIAIEIVLKKAGQEAGMHDRGEEPGNADIVPDDVKDVVAFGRSYSKGYAALEELIGMEKITERVKEIVAQVKVSATNEKLERPCIHMRFTGAPGTGKTTVARILGEIFREEGILRKGGFFEYSGRDLVAEYVGQTAVKTSAICRDAYGSVLFIDEAYSLYSEGGPGNNDFGREAVTTLVAEMENHRDDMLVVMAGYTDDMDRLMKMNEGLRSRMPIMLHFENYTREQLFEIFMLMVRKHFAYSDDLEAAAKEYFLALTDEYMGAREFSNARFVRNLYERTWSKAALRASLEGRNDFILKKEDFTAASLDREFSEKIGDRQKIGF